MPHFSQALFSSRLMVQQQHRNCGRIPSKLYERKFREVISRALTEVPIRYRNQVVRHTTHCRSPPCRAGNNRVTIGVERCGSGTATVRYDHEARNRDGASKAQPQAQNKEPESRANNENERLGPQLLLGTTQSGRPQQPGKERATGCPGDMISATPAISPAM